MKRSQRFLIWLVVLAGVWVFANLPQDGGALLRHIQWAGCPWTFATWGDGSLEFSTDALAADMALGLAVIVSIASLCAWLQGATRPDAAPGRQEDRLSGVHAPTPDGQ